MTLGYKIKSRREELGLDQKELAKKAMVSQSYISRAERDLFKPKATTLMVIAISLDLPPNAFIQDERRAG